MADNLAVALPFDVGQANTGSSFLAGTLGVAEAEPVWTTRNAPTVRFALITPLYTS